MIEAGFLLVTNKIQMADFKIFKSDSKGRRELWSQFHLHSSFASKGLSRLKRSIDIRIFIDILNIHLF